LRVWHGNDSNPCTFTRPCRTLQAALPLARPGGEVRSLHSADYSYVAINQAVTLLGAHGATGEHFSGVTINAGANDVVTLRGLEIAGAGSGADGIQFDPGTVSNSAIANNGTGLALQLAGSRVTGNGFGWIATNGGQVYSPGGSNSIRGNTIGNAAPPARPSTPMSTPAPTVVKNIVTDFGAACNGARNDNAAFTAFNSWAKTWQARYSGQIELDIPSGSVTLLTPRQASLFQVGNWALIAGLDMMGYGHPSNTAFFEYVQITAINPNTGAITFAAPLRNGYKSTWPLYFAGNANQTDQGGPATLCARSLVEHTSRVPRPYDLAGWSNLCQ
jgi:hypothetical protein